MGLVAVPASAYYLKKKYTFRVHTLKKLAYLQHENTPTTYAHCVNNTTRTNYATTQTKFLTLNFLTPKPKKNEYTV